MQGRRRGWGAMRDWKMKWRETIRTLLTSKGINSRYKERVRVGEIERGREREGREGEKER